MLNNPSLARSLALVVVRRLTLTAPAPRHAALSVLLTLIIVVPGPTRTRHPHPPSQAYIYSGSHLERSLKADKKLTQNVLRPTGFDTIAAGRREAADAFAKQAELLVPWSELHLPADAQYVATTLRPPTGREIARGQPSLRPTPPITVGGRRYRLPGTAVRASKAVAALPVAPHLSAEAHFPALRQAYVRVYGAQHGDEDEEIHDADLVARLVVRTVVTIDFARTAWSADSLPFVEGVDRAEEELPPRAQVFRFRADPEWRDPNRDDRRQPGHDDDEHGQDDDHGEQGANAAEQRNISAASTAWFDHLAGEFRATLLMAAWQGLPMNWFASSTVLPDLHRCWPTPGLRACSRAPRVLACLLCPPSSRVAGGSGRAVALRECTSAACCCYRAARPLRPHRVATLRAHQVVREWRRSGKRLSVSPPRAGGGVLLARQRRGSSSGGCL